MSANTRKSSISQPKNKKNMKIDQNRPRRG
jgi:hypothetical protein